MAATRRPRGVSPEGPGSARARREEQRRQRQRQRQWRLLAGTVVGVAAVAAVVAFALTRGSGSASSVKQAAGLLAPIGAESQGQTVDGIECQTSEQLLFHVHAHLAVFVDGSERTVPAGIGIPTNGRCIYWLHSHTDDGIIHIESPVKRTFTLGDYFDVWGQPLDAGHVGPAAGPVTAYLDGSAFSGDPRTIPLAAHAVIQLDVGTNVPPRAFSFPAGE